MASVILFPRGENFGAGLFRPKIVRMMPSERGGADRKYEGISEDGHNWMLKLSDKEPVAISEWLGYKLSEATGIAVPYHHVVELPGGGFAFGSRIEGGLEELKGTDLPVVRLQKAKGLLSKIFALDLVLSNDDRHPDNLLWRRNSLGEDVPMAIDFGRALLMHGWPLPNICNQKCNTTDQIRALRAVNAWCTESADALVRRVQAVSAPDVASWIDGAPKEWIKDLERTRFLNWWGSDSFQERLDDCIMFCK